MSKKLVIKKDTVKTLKIKTSTKAGNYTALCGGGSGGNNPTIKSVV